MIQKHISKVFRYPEVEQELGIQGRVNVMFDIRKDGTIGGIRMRGPSKTLKTKPLE
jgi:protein TonB